MKESPPLPEHIGPYRITGSLGRGGMGEVLGGYDDRLDRPVALKRIHPDGKDPEMARQRFKREARVVARLSHPAIVQVHDWVEAEDQDWLVMELVEGTPLDAVLAAGPLPPRRAVPIARQLAAGLVTAHQAGLVHRDLKPANVMVTTSDDDKILDFGIAKTIQLEAEGPANDARLTTLTEAGQLVGTVAFMSPEQALGWPVDQRSDLFSLGTLLYEMLSGVSPFQGETSMQTLNRICSVKQAPLAVIAPQLPDALIQLVERLLEKEPARRPADALDVLERLEHIDIAALAEAQPANPSSTIVRNSTDSQNTTLAVATAPGLALPEDTTASTTYTTRKLPGSWGVPLIIAGLLAAIGLWSVSPWRAPTGKQAPSLDARSVTLRPVDEEPKLTSHALYERGMAALERYDRKGNIDQALADFQRALARDSQNAPAFAGLARAYWLDFFSGSQDPQRIDQALAAALRAVELNEYLAIARVSLGMAYSELGRAEDALKELEHALQLEPLNADARFGLSVFYSSQGKPSEALVQIQLAIEAQPDRWHLPARLGNLYLTTGQYGKAEAAFRDSLELAPDNFLSFRNLGVALFYQGKLAEAASQFQLALQVQPDPSVYSNLGTIYFAQGLYAQSVSAFREAIETGGGSNNYLLWANLADAYRWTPDNASQARDAYLRAIQLLREKLDTAPQNLTSRTRLSVYLAKRGDCDQALADIAKLGNLPGDDGRAWVRIAVANEICARREAALAALEKALQAKLAVAEIQDDPELLNLRQDVRYHQLVMHLRAVED